MEHHQTVRMRSLSLCGPQVDIYLNKMFRVWCLIEGPLFQFVLWRRRSGSIRQ